MNNDKNIVLHLAPMAGAGDRAFRELCAEYGADEFYTEMISAKAVSFGDKKSFELAESGDSARPCRIQIFGHEEKLLAESAKVLCERFKPDGFDINMGCPVPKITKNGDGSRLMQDPELCGRLLFAVKNAVGIPTSAKIRAGWDEDSINAAEVAKCLEQAGADRICIHGRTKKDLYLSGTVKNHIIKEAASAVHIPIIANGDISDIKSLKKMQADTGCTHFMIGRAAIGHPWIFAEIKNALCGTDFTFDKKEIMKKHLLLASQYKNETYIYEMRMHMAHYLKGFRGAADLRNKVSAASSMDDYLEIIDMI